MKGIHTVATMILNRLYVYCRLCWMLLALSALGSERETEMEKTEAMNVVTETFVKELENGENIELCVWKYYDRNQVLCKIAVQQVNSTKETYWLMTLAISFSGIYKDDDGEFVISLFNVSFLGCVDLAEPAMDGEICKEHSKLAVNKNEFIVRETMKHYMSQEHPPEEMSIYIYLSKTGGPWDPGISFETESERLKQPHSED